MLGRGTLPLTYRYDNEAPNPNDFFVPTHILLSGIFHHIAVMMV